MSMEGAIGFNNNSVISIRLSLYIIDRCEISRAPLQAWQRFDYFDLISIPQGSVFFILLQGIRLPYMYV